MHEVESSVMQKGINKIMMEGQCTQADNVYYVNTNNKLKVQAVKL